MSEDVIPGSDGEAEIAKGDYSPSPARGFLVDFLGSLLPGATFLLSLGPSVAIPAYYLVESLWTGESSGTPLALTVPNSTVVLLLIFVPSLAFFLALSYLTGQLFSRQDPKRPDLASYKKLSGVAKRESMVRPDSRGEPDVQFPYKDLKAYLSRRALYYLADQIPWDGEDGETYRRRSKHFVNALKIRLEFSYPSKTNTIVRNEGHVRLSSSMWYVALQGTRLGVVGVILAAGAIAVQAVLSGAVWPNPYYWVPVLPLVTTLAFVRISQILESVLHYQREREVLFILETAHWATVCNPRVNLFQDLARDLLPYDEPDGPQRGESA